MRSRARRARRARSWWPKSPHHGGLGSVVAATLAHVAPAPIEFVNLGDRYAESGKPDDLLRKYGMTADAIITAAASVLRRR